jgi:hypothetical protein
MRIQLRNVILEVANVVDVQRRTREGAPLKPEGPVTLQLSLRRALWSPWRGSVQHNAW